MKIQISQNKILPEHFTVWTAHGDGVDLVADVKNLAFRPGSVEEIVSFHVLDHLFPEEIVPTLTNWRKCLAKDGRVVILVDDFEYIARGFVAGDFSMEVMNGEHCHPTQFTQHYLANQLYKAGFNESDVVMWYNDVAGLCAKKHYELAISAKNHG